MLLFSMIQQSEPVAEDIASVLDGCIARMAKGDSTAVETLYNLVKTPIYSFAFSILKNPHDAEDVLHDTVLKVWSAAATYSSVGKPMAWVLTISRNLCMMKLRGGKGETEFAPEMLDGIKGADAEDKILITQCMSQLSTEEREIVVLHAVSGFKHREIAQFMEIPLPTVLSKYNRAIKKLKELYKGE